MNSNIDNKQEKNRNIMLILAIALILIIAGGGTMAWLTWRSENNTAVSITVEGGTLTIDGGGDITGFDMAPTTQCNHSDYAIKREINANAINGTATDMLAKVQLYTNSTLFPNVYKMENLEWVISSSDSDCTTSSNVLASGDFANIDNSSDTSKKENIPLDLISFSVPSGQTVNKTYYLYIWVNEDYTITNVGDNVTNSIQGKSFTVQLAGQLTNDPYMKPEAPVLDEGMIPVTISDTGVTKTISKNSPDWYDYENKEWANMVLVNEESRSTYLGTSNVTISEDDILAYYVWIPRYKYRITGKKCSEVDNPSVESNPECYAPYTMSDSDRLQLNTILYNMLSEEFTSYTEEQAILDVQNGLEKGILDIVGIGSMSIVDFVNMLNGEMELNLTITSSSFNASNTSSGPNTIDIAFEVGDAQVTNGNAITTFRTHPAFVWNGVTKSGIWVGKFETSGDATTPMVKPNVESLTNQNVSTQFITSLKFAGGTLTNGNVSFTGNNTYGLTTNTDSHMMKNSEWGSVAYLSHSKYGINEEIYTNNSFSYYTGRSAGSVGSDDTETSIGGSYNWIGQPVTDTTTYGTATDVTLGTKASTTGNVTGVYDMSGGAWEYVMGVLADLNGNPRSGYSSNFNSEFNGIIYDDGNNTEYISGITFPNAKYYDLYNGTSSTDSCTGSICYGHSLSETAGWYLDFAFFVGAESPWFMRGGNYGSGALAGVFSSYYAYGHGSAFGLVSWRSVLVGG